METDEFTPEILEAMLKQDEKENVMSADEVILARALLKALKRIKSLEDERKNNLLSMLKG